MRCNIVAGRHSRLFFGNASLCEGCWNQALPASSVGSLLLPWSVSAVGAVITCLCSWCCCRQLCLCRGSCCRLLVVDGVVVVVAVVVAVVVVVVCWSLMVLWLLWLLLLWLLLLVLLLLLCCGCCFVAIV